LDRPENNPADVRAAGAEDVWREPGMVKERETKEDGRYIIFYEFDDEADEEEENS
jgi:hypothetical protein